MKTVISVFGSSSPQPGSPAYEEAHTTGRLLAEAGYSVATGGYGGVMAAVSQGAAAAGGHVIGVTATRMANFRAAKANQWVAEEIAYETLRERLLHLVMENDGIIAMPGGIGTLSEVALAWSLLQVGEMKARSLILVGDLWPATIQAFYRADYITQPHLDLLHFASSPETAVTHLTNQQGAK